MYRVIEPFFDLMDGNRHYLPGETFPRDGLSVTVERIKELSTTTNKLGFPVIAEVFERTEKQEQTEKPERKTRKRAKEDAD